MVDDEGGDGAVSRGAGVVTPLQPLQTLGIFELLPVTSLVTKRNRTRYKTATRPMSSL
jgi:hypothetical protein